MKESMFQVSLIKDLKDHYPGCFVIKNDGSNVPQGFPDLTLFYKGRVIFLECKREKNASRRPNQTYYVEYLNRTGFPAWFIFPENKEEIVNAIDLYFREET
mgnify:CR=1 FL=1